jgi:hypothetical protein
MPVTSATFRGGARERGTEGTSSAPAPLEFIVEEFAIFQLVLEGKEGANGIEVKRDREGLGVFVDQKTLSLGQLLLSNILDTRQDYLHMFTSRDCSALKRLSTSTSHVCFHIFPNKCRANKDARQILLEQGCGADVTKILPIHMLSSTDAE